MTRINIVEPSELTDQHLVAEYRETLMVPGSLRRTLRSKNGLRKEKIPAHFTLNTGHVTFFYDKLGYLEKRYQSLIDEMRRRGMNPDPARVFPSNEFPVDLYGDWVPSERDKNVVRERIALRISERPGWYRKYGEKIDGA